MITINSRVPKFDLIIFDLDGVLADTVSSWVWLHDHFGVNNDASYYEYMAGKIDDAEFMRRDIALWLGKQKKLHITDIEQILDKIPIMPGFTETMAILDFLNITAAIVSGGLNHLAHRIAKIGHIPHQKG